MDVHLWLAPVSEYPCTPRILRVSQTIHGHPPMINPYVWVSPYTEDTQGIPDYPRISTHDQPPVSEYSRTPKIFGVSQTIQGRPPMISPYALVSTYTEDTQGIPDYPRTSTHDQPTVSEYPRTPRILRVSRTIRGFPPMINPLCLSIHVHQRYLGYPRLFKDVHPWLAPMP